MTYRVCAADISDVQHASLAPAGWTRRQLPKEVGTCHADHRLLEQGVMLVQSRYQPCVDLVEESAYLDEAGALSIVVGLTGESGYVGDDKSTLGFRAGHTTVSTFCHSAGERRYRSGTSVTQLRLRIDQTAMTRYFGPDAWHTWAPDSSVRLCASQKTSEAVSVHVAAMLHQVAQESAAPIDLHIPALSLLAKVMRGMQKAPSRSAGLSHRDLEKIEHVHEIMQTQLHRPLTLDYLCLTAGLSVFKLKDGIRRRYGTTPHRLLHDLRMQRAWTLLEAGCQVAQAGWQVGYAHPGNFGAAFAAYFGRSPKTVFGKRH